MFTRYIVIVPYYWGAGETIEQAKRNLRSAGGKTGRSPAIYKCTSKYPFITKGDPTPEQAQCFIDGLGGLNTYQCETEQVQEYKES